MFLIGRDAQAPEEPSVIVIDNASYHSRTENKLPKLNWKKELLLEFMEAHEILGAIVFYQWVIKQPFDSEEWECDVFM